MMYVVWTKSVCHSRQDLRELLEATQTARFGELVVRTMYNAPYGPPAGGMRE